jgi:hypothetical protein
MKILSSVPNTVNPEFVSEQLEYTLYPLSPTILKKVNDLIDGSSTLILFSGNYRLPWSSVYVEAKMFELAAVPWKPNTIFVDPSQPQLIDCIIKHHRPQKLVILNSNIFLQYGSWTSIMSNIDHYNTLVESTIVTIPLTRFDFNRLKYSNSDIANLMRADILDETLIICR